MATQSLYRRYRPRRFSEVRGQEHVVRALRNAVREDRVGHAYLFSGPRGTGKTTTARILAKVLNCATPVDGEPCCECDSCLAVEVGASLDVLELDAASHNGVDDMRELVANAALGSPGRTKLYVLDEVHMLSKAAANALLKTLEEPPGHVVFVLATTDPQKVLETIRSRTQHFQFHLLASDVLADHVRWVAKDAGLDLPPEAIDHAVRRGGGSARDTLSVIDQISAAGMVTDDRSAVTEAVDALCERDTGAALVAVARAVAAGRDPNELAGALLERLRNAFLSVMAPELVQLVDAERDEVVAQAGRLRPPAIVRALELLGEAMVDMREAPDPRVPLEVALVRLTRPDADVEPAAILERLERLERATHEPALKAPAPSAGSTAATTSSPPPPPPTPKRDKPAPPKAPAAEAPAADIPDRDSLTLAWGDTILPSLPGFARPLFSGGRFLPADGGVAVFALPNEIHRQKCEERRAPVEEALAAHFGRPVPLQLVVDTGATAAPPAASSEPEPEPEEHIDLHDLSDAADAGVPSEIDRLTAVFPGAELIEEETT